MYYTPQYIVDYIVENTIGKLIGSPLGVGGKKPEEVSKLKIVDPACGSGSFLLGAYEHLLKWHSQYYMPEFERLSSIAGSGDYTTKQRNDAIKDRNKLPLTPDGNLTTAIKKQILLNNLYGVDIDVQAVEVTKLSLLLKCMEGETGSSITAEMRFGERVLPTLDNNIKSGNSLVDMDFYDGQLNFEPGVEKKVKPFSWQQAFPQVFKQGGFDAVIGNPPYGASLSEIERLYLNEKFKVGNTDTAALFMLHANKIIIKKGLVGFIIPKSFTYASNWMKTRNELLEDLTGIVDCSKVWREVKLEMSIYLAQKGSNKEKFESSIRKENLIERVDFIDKKLITVFEFLINGLSNKEINLGLTLKNQKKNLHDYVTNQRGAMLQRNISNKGEIKVIGGKQIGRFNLSNDSKGFIRSENISDKKAFLINNSILVQNIVAHVMNPYPRIIIIATLNESISNCVILDTVNQLQNISDVNSKVILGILNSKLISWYTYKFIFANAIRTMHFDSTATEKIPFPVIDLSNKNDKSLHDEIVKLVDSMLQLQQQKQNVTLATEQEQLTQRIQYTDNAINQHVYTLYGLTEDEIKMVEGV